MLLAGAGGCGGAATVSGKVTYQGRAVTHGSVIILSADNGARSGAIQPDGSFTVYEVKPGEVQIVVISRDPAKSRAAKHREVRSKGSGTQTAPIEPAATDWFPLPARFEDPGSSGLGVTLGSGHVKHDIELN